MEDKVLSEYFELLRYESVGADPSHLRDCVSCASWLRKWLGALGFSAELVEKYVFVVFSGLLCRLL